MAVDRSYVAMNDAERKRLESFIARCSDADLERAMPAGWTVAATLAHMAFWDERVRVLFARWEREGSAPPPEDEVSVDWINDSAKPMFLALPPRRRVCGEVMAGGKRPLLSRTDVVLVLVVPAGLVTPLTALSSRPAGWMLIVDAILSALLGLVVALIIVSGVRVLERWWKSG